MVIGIFINIFKLFLAINRQIDLKRDVKGGLRINSS